jgi:phosphate transport system protein
VVNRFPKIQPVEGVIQMGRMVARQIHEVVHAYIERDAQRALEAWRHDTEIDDYFDSLFREILHYMMGAPDSISLCTHLAFIAKNIERVGDHCTTVAASTYYLVTGEPIRDTRPKGVDPRFTIVER